MGTRFFRLHLLWSSSGWCWIHRRRSAQLLLPHQQLQLLLRHQSSGRGTVASRNQLLHLAYPHSLFATGRCPQLSKQTATLRHAPRRRKQPVSPARSGVRRDPMFRTKNPLRNLQLNQSRLRDHSPSCNMASKVSCSRSDIQILYR